MRSISFHSPKDIIKCHFALFSTTICKSRNDPRNSIFVEKLFEKLNSVENRDREISFRLFETENREMGCHSRIENDFVEISTTLFRNGVLRKQLLDINDHWVFARLKSPSRQVGGRK